MGSHMVEKTNFHRRRRWWWRRRRQRRRWWRRRRRRRRRRRPAATNFNARTFFAASLFYREVAAAEGGGGGFRPPARSCEIATVWFVERYRWPLLKLFLRPEVRYGVVEVIVQKCGFLPDFDGVQMSLTVRWRLFRRPMTILKKRLTAKI